MQADIAPLKKIPLPDWIARLQPWHELTAATSILMELSWAVLWYRLFILPGRQIAYSDVFLMFGGMLIFVYLLSRYMQEKEIDSLLRRVILLGVLLVNVLVGLELILYSGEFVGINEMIQRLAAAFRSDEIIIPPEFAFILLIMLVNWRGVAFSNVHIDPGDILKRFRFGVIMLFIYGIVLPLLEFRSGLALYLFLFFSLLAMSSARISMLNRMRGGRVNRLNRNWFMGITAVILSIVGASALAVALVGNRLFEYLANLVTWAIFLFISILSPVMYFLMWLFIYIQDLLRLDAFFELLQTLIQTIRDAFDTLASTIQGLLGTLDREGLRLFLIDLSRTKPFLLWGAVIFVLLLILISVRRFVKRDDVFEEGDFESLLDEQDLFGLMRRALRRGWNQLSERLEEILNISSARRFLAAARIRRIYAGLMELSAKLDHPRPAARTPLEFLPNLVDLFPGRNQDLAMITQAYLAVRYGGIPESLDEVEDVEDAWRRVKIVGKELGKHKPKSM